MSLEESFIVKIQASLANSENRAAILVYNEDESIRFEERDNPQPILKLLAGEVKAFHWATIDKQTGLLNLGERAPWQEW